MDHPRSGFVARGQQTPTEQFHARCAETLLKLFEYMIRMDVTEAACVTHGGVIMTYAEQCAARPPPPDRVTSADPATRRLTSPVTAN